MDECNNSFTFIGKSIGQKENIKGVLRTTPELNGIEKGSISKKNLEKNNLSAKDLVNKEVKVLLVELNPQKTGWILDLCNSSANQLSDESVSTPSTTRTQIEKDYLPRPKKLKKVVDVNKQKIKEEKKEISSFDMVDIQGKGTVKSFKMAKYVVVQKLYKELMEKNPSHFKKDGEEDKLPVESVSWNDVILFCNALSFNQGLKEVYVKTNDGWTINVDADGYRLPTVEEWHFAANEGEEKAHYAYSGSNNIQQVAWWQGDDPSATHSVDDNRKTPNKLGLYGMSGNVWEWCWDAEGKDRLCCGGAYNSSEEEIKLSSIKNIRKVNPNTKDYTIGFRLVKSN